MSDERGRKQARLMFVEDDDNDWFLTDRLLRRLGLQNDRVRVPNGDQALQILSVFHPDIVFVDLRMPDKDGVEVAQAILNVEALDYVADEPPLFIALTHSTDPFDLLETTVASQFFGYFTKYLTVDKLDRLNQQLEPLGLELVFSRSSEETFAPDDPTEPAPDSGTP